MKNSTIISRGFLSIVFTAIIFLAVTRGSAQVRAWEGTITIPTYSWAEDINPKFWALEGQQKLSTTVKGTIVYPYPMQDHLFRTKEDREYKALFLENEYLKVTCLPELGGRLHSVFDKTENEEVFHLNNVIKPGMIAMRGAFISGGVEWNAGPQVHTVTILSPVNALIGRNEDGSAFLEISNLEKSLRTRWTVRVTLFPGRSYLDERIRIFNPIDAMNPYYFWNCTAFPNRPGTRFIYPMTLGTDHNGVEFFNWPVHEGRDLSWLKNYETWASIFAVDCGYDFFGAYDVDMDRGVVQVADHNELSGKKAWTWGNWDFGLVSQKNLTDDDGPYIEVQSGPLPTQSDYGRLMPRESVSWQEWWYPVHGLGDGFEFATRDIAFQTDRKNDNLVIRLIATGKFPGAICSVTRDDTELLNRKMDLSPNKPEMLALSPIPASAVKVTVKTAEGALLAEFSTPLPIPVTTPPEVSTLMTRPDGSLSVEEKVLKALKFDLATDRIMARRYYEMVLEDDPDYSDALRGLAVLDMEAGLYSDAERLLKKALQRRSSDGLAWYFLGVCQLRMENDPEALRCAYRAVRSFGTVSLGYDLAGRVFMRFGEYDKAYETFHKAHVSEPEDTRIKDHLLMALHALGDRESAIFRAGQRIEENATDLVPRAILALRSEEEMDRFATDVRSFIGEIEFEMLEVGLYFAELGLTAEAGELLRAVCIDPVSQETTGPLSLYYLAYISHLSGDPAAAREYLTRASGMYRDFTFPSRPEAVEILHYAIEMNPQDVYAHLHLGNLLGNLGRLDEAVQYWQKAVAMDGSLNIAYRNLGLYAWVVESDCAKAEQYYKKAIAAQPKDQTLYRDLGEILLADGRRSQAITLLESTPFEKLRRADIIIMLAQAYMDGQMYDKTIDLLESTPYFVNWEGQTITWDLFNRAHIRRGESRYERGEFETALQDFEAALTYPKNIGVGRTNRPREAPAQYWRGKALRALGRVAEARAAWELGADGHEGGDEQNRYRELCKQSLAE